MHIQPIELKHMERFYRANLINSLGGFKPAVMAGTADSRGRTNLALFSNLFHVGSDPALIGYVQRPVGQSGDTFRNIEATGAYTFNFADVSMLEKAHFTSARFAEDTSEFDACKLTPQWVDGFAAPFVLECGIKIGLKLADIIPYDRNGTKFVIGSVEHILLPDGLLLEDGHLALDAAELLCTAGLEQYYRPTLVRQMPYAKVENLPEF
jgi:flavin reductase (DIM6/NTAB) family NADH-FMN oxidoreductase RutF